MAMGMSYSQFWDEPPYLAVAFRKAYRLKREVDNENFWLQGLYMYDAVAVALQNAFSKRGVKKEKYLERPIDIFPLTEVEKARREEKERKKMQAAMEAMAKKQRNTKGD